MGGGQREDLKKKEKSGLLCLCFHRFIAARPPVDALRSFLSSPPISHLPLRAAQLQRLCALPPLHHCEVRGHVIWWMKGERIQKVKQSERKR